ncbi:hypothetical protein H0H81_005454 [Sphagnurus paluster]|uniref:Uncharacterized protein n=1 Tax=Sphagnurus paluster TaxID=117069 RepID=A0A9P7KJ10_9AGAR|nr:hypothetical protein H0H81_005454 [Sphagnurus paluster]
MAVDSLSPIALSPLFLDNDRGVPLYNFPMYTLPVLECDSDDTLATSAVEDLGPPLLPLLVFLVLTVAVDRVWRPIAMTPPALTASSGQVSSSKIDDYLSSDAAAAAAILREDRLHNRTGFRSSFCDPKALAIGLRALESDYLVPIGLADTVRCAEYASTLLSLSMDRTTNDMDLDVPVDITPPPAPLVSRLELDTNHLVIMDGDTPVSLVTDRIHVGRTRRALPVGYAMEDIDVFPDINLSILFQAAPSCRGRTTGWYGLSGRCHMSSSYTPGNGYYEDNGAESSGGESGYDADDEQ